MWSSASSFDEFWEKKVLPKLTWIQRCLFTKRNTVKDGTNVVSLDEFKSIGTHWISLHVNGNNLRYLDSFGVKHISTEIKKNISNKNIKTNAFTIQPNSIMYGCFCIGFVDFIFKDKSLRDFSNSFATRNFKKNDKVIMNYFLNSTTSR